MWDPVYIYLLRTKQEIYLLAKKEVKVLTLIFPKLPHR